MAALNFAARSLGYARDRYDVIDLDTDMRADDCTDLFGQMHERVRIFSVQDKNQQLLGLTLPGIHAGSDHFAEFKTIHLSPLHIVDRFINDAVVANIDAGLLDCSTGCTVRTNIESDDDGV